MNQEIDTQKRISRDVGDTPVKQFRDDRDAGYLELQPHYQRRSVWDAKKKSRLIESAILGIPLPAIYLSEESDGRYSVIDGQQRLTAFFDFIDPKPGFKLSSEDKSLNGKKFTALTEDLRRRILTYTIRTITFHKGADENLKYKIFERLNSGAVSLNAQEMRNCVYHGAYNDLLHALSVDKDFKKLMGYDSPHPRMGDVELVLRFSAFFFQTDLRYKSPIKKFLDNEMAERRDISEKQQKELEEAFKNACWLCSSLFEKGEAFRRFVPGNAENPAGHWDTSVFNVSLYDILMGGFARTPRNLATSNLDAIREALIQLMATDQEFIDSITKSTSSTKVVNFRFDKWRTTLKQILGDKREEPRCFSRELKDKLYKQNRTCRICGNRIAHVDDAAVDHIEQYWRGGKTIPENARLVHRHCNLVRPRND